MSDLIEAFLALATHRHMGAAASSIYLSQPAFSARIAKLEREVGYPLFHRRRDGMVLTAAGEAFLPYAQDMVNSLEQGYQVARDTASGLEPVIRIGSGPVVNDYILPHVFARLRRTYPAARIRNQTMDSATLVAAVRAQQLDLGIVSFRYAEDQDVLYESEVRAFMSPDYPLEEMVNADDSGVSQVTIIRVDGRPDLKPSPELEAQLRCSPHATIVVDRVESATRMVRQGLGISVLSSTIVATHLDDESLVPVPLEHNAPARTRMVAVRRVGLPETRLLTALYEQLHLIPTYVSGTFVPSHVTA